MGLHGEGIGGVIFLALYLCNLSILVFGFTTRRIKIASVYAFLLFHITLRLAAQVVNIILGTEDEINVGVLIAFYVLGAEGYFSLVLCTYRFLIHHHEYTMPISGSWLEGKRIKYKDGQKPPLWRRTVRALRGQDETGKKDPWVMTIIHWVLIAANAVIISGSSQTNASNASLANYQEQVHRANIFRYVGQICFLLINILLIAFLIITVRQDRNPSGTLPPGLVKFFRNSPDHGQIDAIRRGGPFASKPAPILRILLFAWPLLIIRGIFGLLQAVVPAVNYTTVNVYRTDVFQFKTYFVVVELIFTVLMEWMACFALCCTMFTDEENRIMRNKYKASIRQGGELAGDEEAVVGRKREVSRL